MGFWTVMELRGDVRMRVLKEVLGGLLNLRAFWFCGCGEER